MQTVFKGRVWKFGDMVSTDLMMPGSLVLARQLSEEEAAKYCFYANRPEFAKEVKPGDIVVAGKNFGCGSSRPGARMIQLNGVSAVLADSTSRIFLRNAINYALPTLWCKGVSAAFDDGDTAEVNIETGVVKNLTKGTTIQGDAWPKDSPPYQILMAGGLIPFIKKMMAERGMKASARKA
ncbi:MAG: 3-isopropylmalate dehydratase [Chloroflexi bacterium]|nr:3-isopropylmalate dehydratase [Chloroflexota bacterium]